MSHIRELQRSELHGPCPEQGQGTHRATPGGNVEGDDLRHAITTRCEQCPRRRTGKETQVRSIENAGVAVLPFPIEHQSAHDRVVANIGDRRDNYSRRRQQFASLGQHIPGVDEVLQTVIERDAVKLWPCADLGQISGEKPRDEAAQVLLGDGGYRRFRINTPHLKVWSARAQVSPKHPGSTTDIKDRARISRDKTLDIEPRRVAVSVVGYGINHRCQGNHSATTKRVTS